MPTEYTVDLGSLSVGDTFVYSGFACVVLNPSNLPPADPGKVWNMAFNDCVPGQAVSSTQVIPTALKVVHA